MREIYEKPFSKVLDFSNCGNEIITASGVTGQNSDLYDDTEYEL